MPGSYSKVDEIVLKPTTRLNRARGTVLVSLVVNSYARANRPNNRVTAVPHPPPPCAEHICCTVDGDGARTQQYRVPILNLLPPPPPLSCIYIQFLNVESNLSLPLRTF